MVSLAMRNVNTPFNLLLQKKLLKQKSCSESWSKISKANVGTVVSYQLEIFPSNWELLYLLSLLCLQFRVKKGSSYLEENDMPSQNIQHFGKHTYSKFVTETPRLLLMLPISLFFHLPPVSMYCLLTFWDVRSLKICKYWFIIATTKKEGKL